MSWLNKITGDEGKMMRFLSLALGVMLSLAAHPAAASEFKIGGVTVETPWSRATPGKARSGVVYLTISNQGNAPDRLVSISTSVATRAEIHRSQMKGGMMTMNSIGALTLRPASSVLLRPGGLHVMLMGLKAPLKRGGSFNMTLKFEKAGSLTVKVAIEKIGASAPMRPH
jgi:periplasmic copper chaperone A